MTGTVREIERGKTQPEVSDHILTVPNVITFVRLLMAPVALCLLLLHHDIAAGVLFGATAATDFLDGQIARRTNCVTKLGQILDPAVDRLLMICGVVGLLAVGRLPVWVVIVVLARDVFLLIGGAVLLRERQIRVPVVYVGKVATTLLFVGLFGLIVNVPVVSGLGVCSFGWLPGFNAVPCSWGIWCVYAGLLLAVFTTFHYVRSALEQLGDSSDSREAGA